MGDEGKKGDAAKQADVKTSAAAKREEEILAFWKEQEVFKKTLEKDAPAGEFVFYEGPPTANGRPGIHHVEARAFKDAIPRYKTMRGYHVRRKAGWDTHGLPVELEVEKQLGLKSKKEIEEYGIAAFNEKCKESVWKYLEEWNRFTERVGYWVDQEHPYVTYTPEYIESLWAVLAKVHERGLLYKDYKVLPWCPRCGTALSSHELAQGYKDVKDLAVTVKFKLVAGQKIGEWDVPDNTFILAWTTTPWTLPGNVALAVNQEEEYWQVTFHDDYCDFKKGETYVALGSFIVDAAGVPPSYSEGSGSGLGRKEEVNFSMVEGSAKATLRKLFGKELIGLIYEPLYPFMQQVVEGEEKKKLDEKAYHVYAADFVTTEDGTGVVHTAVMYGQDDFVLGTEVGLPKHHLVNLDGTFVDEADFLAKRFVKEKDDKGKPTLDLDIIDDLKKGGYYFNHAPFKHSYPHCWRCKTPVIYYARDSWYIKMSALRDELVKENESINWVPEYIKEGRFGEWLREIKDWAISRERYWGTPLPIWTTEDGSEIVVIGSLEEFKRRVKHSGNSYVLMRHGPAQNNIEGRISSLSQNPDGLTEEGVALVRTRARELKERGGVDIIVTSPLLRTRETTKIVQEELGLSDTQVIIDGGFQEIQVGALEGKTWKDYYLHFGDGYAAALRGKLAGGENIREVAVRAVAAFRALDAAHAGKRILVISHGGVLRALVGGLQGLTDDGAVAVYKEGAYLFAEGEMRDFAYVPLPLNGRAELDVHRPYIDELSLVSESGKPLVRVPEVMDVWFDSGAMPFAQDHYPFENKEWIEGAGYPADYISEAIDQTRGWFYTLHAVGVLMGRGKAFKNVISLGHILDAEGKKMSKSVGNVVDPWGMMEKYGVDTLRFWMYSVNQPGDSKNFDERTVDEIVKKVFNLLENSLKFYELHAGDADGENVAVLAPQAAAAMPHILDRWIVARTHLLVREITAQLDGYNLLSPTRGIRDLIADLSQWYIRRSRERFKEAGDDRTYARATARYVLSTLAKLLAPFAPFTAEDVYRRVRGASEPESVHLCTWPPAGAHDEKVLADMRVAREMASRLLEQRAAAGIKVRQILKAATITAALDGPYLALIADEVNVKEVRVGGEVQLDTTITEELKLEGALREVVRAVQQLRKEAGCAPQDEIALEIGESAQSKRLVDLYDEQLKAQVRAKTVMLVARMSGTTVALDGGDVMIRLG